MSNKTNIMEQEEFKIFLQMGKISCNILHDLINPITSLHLMLENDKSTKKYADEILESQREIIKFITAVQETVENPKRIEMFDLGRYIQNSIFVMRYKAKRYDARIVFIQNIHNVRIKANKLNVYQIMMNLIGNSLDAFKDCNNKRNTVTIFLTEENEYLKLSVSDNGSGIKKKDINNIFNKGYSTKDEGLGIGLNTVENIVNGYGGNIEVKSKLNKGTKFNIYLPKNITNLK